VKLPASIGPYPVTGLLGQGGMGVVYAARHPTLGFPVAVKVLLAGREANPKQRERFAREVRTLTRLSHPNLVEVLDAGEEGGLPWFSMRALSGESLGARLSRGPLEIADALEMARQVCEGLEAAHAAGVLHRDLKPDNVLCTSHGSYVVVDFGLAKDLELESALRLSQTGMIQGTPRYWAPEQAEGLTTSPTPATDVYLLGALLYAALTGRPPIEGETLIEIMVATREADPVPPRVLRSETPPWLNALVLRCLLKAPSARFASMRELGAALREPPPSSWGRGPLFVGVGALALAALLGLTLWTLRARGPATSPDPAPVSPRPTSPDIAQIFSAGLAAAEAGDTQGAVEELRRAAEAGHARSMYAYAAYLGGGVAKQPLEATRWLERAASAGYPEALFDLGVSLSQGEGARNFPRAAECYRQAAEAGIVEAMVNLSQLLINEPSVVNLEEGVAWCRAAAKKGELGSMHALGSYYYRGLGLPRDLRAMRDWYARAAEGGHPKAMYDLGLVYARGLGVERDLQRTRKWWRKAVEAGSPQAMAALGQLLCKQEHQAAAGLGLLRKAADLGNARAMGTLGIMLLSGYRVPQDPKLGLAWLRRSASTGNGTSMLNLGRALSRGKHVPPDLKEARAWLEKASEHDDRTIREGALELLNKIPLPSKSD
jgi:TPR repeat protein